MFYYLLFTLGQNKDKYSLSIWFFDWELTDSYLLFFSLICFLYSRNLFTSNKSTCFTWIILFIWFVVSLCPSFVFSLRNFWRIFFSSSFSHLICSISPSSFLYTILFYFLESWALFFFFSFWKFMFIFFLIYTDFNTMKC